MKLPSPFLRLENVTISRGEKRLLSGINLEVKASELIWVRGSNGIGKTSLLRLIAGLLRPETGTLTYGLDGDITSAKDVIGYQGHQDALKPTLSVRENLRFWANLYGRPTEVISTALEKLEITHLASQKAGTLSAGQSRRAALAQLWVTQKPMWVLDEPAAAIDKSGNALIDSLIVDHIDDGGSVILASHGAPRALSTKARQLTLAEVAHD